MITQFPDAPVEFSEQASGAPAESGGISMIWMFAKRNSALALDSPHTSTPGCMRPFVLRTNKNKITPTPCENFSQTIFCRSSTPKRNTSIKFHELLPLPNTQAKHLTMSAVSAASIVFEQDDVLFQERLESYKTCLHNLLERFRLHG